MKKWESLSISRSIVRNYPTVFRHTVAYISAHNVLEMTILISDRHYSLLHFILKISLCEPVFPLFVISAFLIFLLAIMRFVTYD